MSDLISRQAAIDAIQKNIDEMNHNQKYHADAVRLNGDLIIHGLEIAISAVKSVQPTHETPSNTLKSLDCVDRQAAIDALNEYFVRIGKLKRRGLTKGEKAISIDTVGAIKTLPSVQPEPSQIARDIATIIENEQDMRVMLQPEIIRCKDCKNHSFDAGYGYDWCNRTSGIFRVKPYDFCSMAKRKENR